MTLPEGRKPLLWSDIEFAKPVKADQFNCLSGPHSTWESECRRQTIRAQQAIDEAKALRRDYGLIQIDRNNLRNLLDEAEDEAEKLRDKLEAAEAEAKALRAGQLNLKQQRCQMARRSISL
jgi:chromosome segregation ATPase